MRMLELFSGSGNMAASFRAHGYKTLTVDLSRNADIQKDVCQVTPEEIIAALGGRPDVIWASPPCTAFSVCVIFRNWKDGVITSKKAYEGVELLSHTLRLIMQLQPRIWYIENPRGMMRTLPIMRHFPRRTLTFCQYGDRSQKPTDVWTNNPLFWPKCCHAGDSCHDKQPKGYRAKKDANAHKNVGTQGKNNAYERGKLPVQLCDAVAEIT